MLTFSRANSKLKKLRAVVGGHIFSFDLPAGLTCPNAVECRAWVDDNRVLHDGALAKYRCYAAFAELQYKETFTMRRRNLELIENAGGKEKIVALLEEAFPPHATVIRIHTSGDFFRKDYFEAWLEVIQNHRDVRFYAYTQMLGLVMQYTMPRNFSIIASVGGSQDGMLDRWPYAKSFVVGKNYTGPLPINDDDFIALRGGIDFVLKVHGVQKKGNRYES